MKYDVLIIGAGLSGLSTAIRLAHFGRKVCVLERHRLPGGLNSYYRRRGRMIDTGLHAVTNFAPKTARRAPINRLMRQLRLERDALELCPQLGSTIEGPGATLHFSNHVSDLQDSISQHFPAQVDAFQRLITRVREADLFALDAPRTSATAELAEMLPDRQLRDLILQPIMYYGNAEEHDMDMNQFLVLFHSIFLEGLCRPRDGMRHVLDILVRRFTECDGDIRFGCAAQALHCKDNVVVGTDVTDGSHIQARAVVSCAGLAETLALCNPPLPRSQRVPPGTVSIVESIFFLDRHPRELGLTATVSFVNQAPKFHYGRPDKPVDFRSSAICVPGNYANHDGSADADQVRVTNLADHRTWCSLEPRTYRREKEQVLARQIGMMEKRAPGFADAVIDRDMFTPRTIERYTGHINGALYGTAAKSRGGRTPLRNLYVSGTDQGFLGIVGALLSGVTVANKYLLR